MPSHVVIADICWKQVCGAGPRCALNIEAGRMIDRFIGRGLAPGLVMVAVLAASFLYYFLR